MQAPRAGPAGRPQTPGGGPELQARRRRASRWWAAQVRDLRLLFRQFWGPLVGFATVVLGGALLLMRLYHLSPSRGAIDFGEAAYIVFCLVFFELVVPFPEETGLRVMFFLVPLLGLGFLTGGVMRFGVLAFNKEMRGEAWQKVLASTLKDHVIVCGLGHVGFRVAQELLQLGQDFVVIGHPSKFLEQVRRRDVPVLEGDARDESLLEDAGVARARCIVVATNDDLANLETVINARNRNPGIRAVVRLFDPALAAKLQSALQIDMAFSTSQLSAPAVALAAVERELIHSFYVGDELMSVVELSVRSSSPYAGRTLEDLERENQVTAVLHRRGERLQPHPVATQDLQGEDRVTLLCSLPVLRKLEEQGLERPPAAR